MKEGKNDHSLHFRKVGVSKIVVTTEISVSGELAPASMSLGNAIEQNKLVFCRKGCAQLATAKT